MTFRRASDRAMGRAVLWNRAGLGLLALTIGLHVAGYLGEHVTTALVGVGGIMIKLEAEAQHWKARRAIRDTEEQEAV